MLDSRGRERERAYARAHTRPSFVRPSILWPRVASRGTLAERAPSFLSRASNPRPADERTFHLVRSFASPPPGRGMLLGRSSISQTFSRNKSALLCGFSFQMSMKKGRNQCDEKSLSSIVRQGASRWRRACIFYTRASVCPARGAAAGVPAEC